MKTVRISRARLARIAAACALAATLSACAGGEPAGPAPVYMRDLAGYGEAPPVPMAASEQITVKPGQSLRSIAHDHRVPERAIIAANHLKPPYKVVAGSQLVIPATAAAAAPSVQTASVPRVVPPTALPPPVAASSRTPDVIPLDGPPPARPAVGPPPARPIVAPPSAASAPPPPAVSAPPAPRGEPAATVAADVARESGSPPPKPAAESGAVHGGRYPWPVQGRVLATYGSGAGGTHNDGINIGAAKGAPVKAVDGGVVAYAGNELRGYGNLILVKHANGYITAYAHCDDLLVKQGDKVGRGQTIARVGTTGGVQEPQLHFELRKGKQPVDPREFLSPAPSASQRPVSDRG